MFRLKLLKSKLYMLLRLHYKKSLKARKYFNIRPFQLNKGKNTRIRLNLSRKLPIVKLK